MEAVNGLVDASDFGDCLSQHRWAVEFEASSQTWRNA